MQKQRAKTFWWLSPTFVIAPKSKAVFTWCFASQPRETTYGNWCKSFAQFAWWRFVCRNRIFQRMWMFTCHLVMQRQRTTVALNALTLKCLRWQNNCVMWSRENELLQTRQPATHKTTCQYSWSVDLGAIVPWEGTTIWSSKGDEKKKTLAINVGLEPFDVWRK